MKRYNKYKDSGIAWLGQIPEHWEVRKLREIIEIYSDKGYPNATLLSVVRERGVVVRDIESKEENHNYIPSDLSGYKRVKRGDFVINKMKAWQGSYGVSDYEGIVSPAYYTCKLRCANKSFFHIAVRSATYVPFFTQYSKGIRVGQWDLSPVDLKSIPFIAPPMPEQGAIVSYLDRKVSELDSFVSKQETQISYLKELKQATIAKAVTRGIDPSVALKDSGIPWLGQIPEHWEVRKMRSVFKLSLKKSESEGYQLLSLSQYTGVTLKTDEDKTGMFRAESTVGYNLVREGQFVMNIMLAWNGSYAVSYLNGVISPSYCVYDFVDNSSKEYIAYLLGIKSYQDMFKAHSTGLILSRLRLYPHKFLALPLPLPPLSEQAAIVSYLEEKLGAIDRLIAASEAAIARVRELKQTLIADVVTGRICVQSS